jgi:hypothetical protein
MTGQRFCELFSHRFNFIEAPFGEKPEWKTVSQYPIEHRNLWAAHQDPERLIGLSFGKITRYAILDIDRQSKYHPELNQAAFKALLGLYEDIGITRHISLRSSNSGGLHIYFVFEEALPTFKLAQTLRLTAVCGGFEVKDGQLEIYPNTKAYGEKQKTAYKAVRLPLQQGGHLVDDDFTPYSNDIKTFLDLCDYTAKGQDLELLKTALETANQIKSFKRIKGSGEASRFAADLKEQYQEGWTGYGQTNDLLRVVGTYGRVFEALEGQQLAEFIENTAISLPGYRHYCRHQHNLKQRAKDWGRCIEKYYYPYGEKPHRVGTFTKLKKEAEPKENRVNVARQEQAITRLQKVVSYIQETVAVIPQKIGELKELLINTSRQLFGVTPSTRTLNRYKNYWHPTHQEYEIPEIIEPEVTPLPQVPSPASETPEPSSDKGLEEKTLPPPEPLKIQPEEKQPEPSLDKGLEEKTPPPCYMKVYRLNPERSASGLVSKRVSPTRTTSLRLEVIKPGEILSLCRGCYHSHHPKILYVKPVKGAENWIDGIAVSASFLEPLPDG